MTSTINQSKTAHYKEMLNEIVETYPMLKPSNFDDIFVLPVYVENPRNTKFSSFDFDIRLNESGTKVHTVTASTILINYRSIADMAETLAMLNMNTKVNELTDVYFDRLVKISLIVELIKINDLKHVHDHFNGHKPGVYEEVMKAFSGRGMFTEYAKKFNNFFNTRMTESDRTDKHMAYCAGMYTKIC